MRLSLEESRTRCHGWGRAVGNPGSFALFATAGIEIRGLPPFAKSAKDGAPGDWLHFCRGQEMPRFIPRGPATPVHDCKESRMKFFCFTKLHRKSGYAGANVGHPRSVLRTALEEDQLGKREGVRMEKAAARSFYGRYLSTWKDVPTLPAHPMEGVHAADWESGARVRGWQWRKGVRP
jgi:hypothetical protein